MRIQFLIYSSKNKLIVNLWFGLEMQYQEWMEVGMKPLVDIIVKTVYPHILLLPKIIIQLTLKTTMHSLQQKEEL